MNDIDSLIAYYASCVSPVRIEKMKVVIAARTRYVTVILEDIAHQGNAAAVARSAECFGIQDLYVIENNRRFLLDGGIAKGAEKWLDVHFFSRQQQNTKICYDQLRAAGYKIVATTPHAQGYTLETLPLDKKIALVFGTEKQGLSSLALSEADAYVAIPMHGFTESLNISACAAICMYALTERLKKSSYNWKLTEQEQQKLLLEMLRKDVER